MDGTLAKWNEDRGFGFITPRRGGQDIFVHISAFPKDGQRPRLAEVLSFEIQKDSSGKTRAINVSRPGSAKTTSARRSGSDRPRNSHNIIGPIITLSILVAIGIYGYIEFSQNREIQLPAFASGLLQTTSQTSSTTPAVSYQCDGRTHCSQMSSCEEAKFFLRNCPNVKMDGNRDGIPCEKQWCTGIFGN